MDEVTVLALGDTPASADAVRVDVPELGAGPLATRICARIAVLAPTPPLVIITRGEDAALLPAVALAQRAAGRAVLGYLLIEPTGLEVTDAWPDARVGVIGDDTLARLRGWDAVTDSADWIAALQS